MTTRTDTDRVVQWFRDHPDSTVMECRLGLYVSAVTQRMSDARKEGFVFTKHRDERGHWRFRVSEAFDGTLRLDKSA